MPKYLFHANYVDGGVTGLLKEGGTSRYADQWPIYTFDRKDRRDLCIFQIGLRFLERCLTNELSFNIPLFSYR